MLNGLLVMTSSIEFHDEPSAGAVEVGDVGPDLVLASEPGAPELTAAKTAPQEPFGKGGVPAQPPGPFGLLGVQAVELLAGWRDRVAPTLPLPPP